MLLKEDMCDMEFACIIVFNMRGRGKEDKKGIDRPSTSNPIFSQNSGT
jgi:hypothetical protein